jgi:hypothetical protein
LPAVIIQNKPFCLRKITDTERLFLFFETLAKQIFVSFRGAKRQEIFLLLPIKTGGNIFSGWIKWKK